MAMDDGHTHGWSRRGVLVAFVVGAAAGAVAGLLLAPQAGRESRKQLGSYTREASKACKTFIAKRRSFVDKQQDEQKSRPSKSNKQDHGAMQAEQLA